MAQWRTGQQVRLISGGPVMTVSGEESGKVLCRWFKGDTLKEKYYGPDELKEVKDDDDDGMRVTTGEYRD